MVKEEDVAMFELKYWDVLLGGDARPTQKIIYSAYPAYLAVGENDYKHGIIAIGRFKQKRMDETRNYKENPSFSENFTNLGFCFC